LWFGGHNREVFPYKRVEQRRFADVRPASQDDGTATGHGSKCRIQKLLTRGRHDKVAFPVLALLLAAGCARHTIPPVVLINQTRIGPAEDLGPGITGVQFSGINFDLVSPAHVIVLRVTNSAGIEQVRPARSGDKSQLSRGEYSATAPSFSRSNYAAQSAQRAAYVSGVCGSPYEQDPSRPIPAGADTSRRALPRSNALAQRRYQDCVRRERETTSSARGPTDHQASVR